MIYYVKGDFVIKTATQVVVDCNGVGYDVQISLNTYADIEPKFGNAIHLSSGS